VDAGRRGEGADDLAPRKGTRRNVELCLAAVGDIGSKLEVEAGAEAGGLAAGGFDDSAEGGG
jgi:hypothetical protein